MDDNIQTFYRLARNTIIQFASGTFLRIIEEFADRYSNLLICGMNYEMFAPRRQVIPAYVLNTRVYSNMLIQTHAEERPGKLFRWEGFYNEDTDLCLRMLKAGYCLVQFNAFLAKKLPTMKLQGGNTPNYVKNGTDLEADGRYRMAKELQAKHPDVTTITRKWGRWQHQVNYAPFRQNPLRRVPGVQIPEGVNEYGLQLQQVA
jgi:hypothetical protein